MSANNNGQFAKVRARYNGPIGNHRVIGLATRTKYGRHKRNDVFWVHRSDVEAHPEMFTVLGDDLSAASRLPKTPDDLRFPEIDLSPVFPAELEAASASSTTDEAPVSLDTSGTPLAALGLPGRVMSSLLGAGIETVEGLQDAFDDASLLEISGIGEKTLDEIQVRLEAFNEAY